MTEKSQNMQKLSGEQDRGKNKIHYYEWKSQLTDFIESKGQAGTALTAAMEWAIKAGRDAQISDSTVQQ